MIEYRKGNLFAEKHDYIVHGCNSEGVMGSGVAKIIREIYPKAYKDYIDEYLENGSKLQLGQIIPSMQPDGTIIINAITQGAYGYDRQKYVSYDAVDMCMEKLRIAMIGVDSEITMPKIGAGLGGGNWEIIEAIINHRLKDHKVVVYEL